MSKPNDSIPWRSILFLFCASLVACQTVSGDYKAGVAVGGSVSNVGGQTGLGGKTSGAGSSARAGSSSGGTSANNSCSSDGIYRCTDTAIETCVNRQWQPLQSCSRDLCDSDRGRCMICAPGANRCSAYNLQTCASTGDSWTTTKRCDTAEYCDALSNNCFTCLAGEAFCDGATLYRCNATKSGWDAEPCESPDLCDARAQSCGIECTNTDWVSCNGDSLIGCDGKGHHIQLDKCASSQLCEQTLKDRASNPAGWSGKCSTGCTPESYQCNPDNPSELRACPPSGLKWEHVEDCATPELCDANGQQCKPGCGVAPGTVVCDGAQLERCSDDGTAFEPLKTCADADHCNAQKKDCITCVPGESRCSGAILQTCNADQTWSTSKTCASAALCDATNGACIDPGCTRANAFQCVGSQLQQCAADLTKWKDVETCVTSALCDAINGRCNPVKCPYPNDYRCLGRSVRQQCNEATRDWLDVNTCPADQACDLSSPTGCSASCPEVPARCNTVDSQTDAQVCTMVNGVPVWSTVATCATVALCSAGDAGAFCKDPICTPDQYRCDGQALSRCNAGRTGFEMVKACATGQTCDATGKQCDVCTPNTYTCNSILQLLKCTADGQANNVVDNCSSVANCYTSSDKKTGYCYRCDAGSSQCAGTTQIQTCAADRRGWNTATTCANGCQDNPGNSDYCAACPIANEVQCVDYGAPGSTHKCAADRSAWGATTTCTKGYGCVENGSSDYCADACSPNAAECVGTTARHVCAADGKGWGTTITECASATSLKACTGGQFSGSTACPSATPYCVNGQCVECTGTAVECSASNTLATCNNGKWVYSTCPSTTPICSGNACVACTSGSTSTCTNTTTRHYCATDNTWKDAACSGTTPYCQGGACVECTNSSPATCASNNTVQSCSNGKYVTTTCAGATPVCYAASGGAVCAACNASTTPACVTTSTGAAASRICVNGSFADTVCTGESSYCLNGFCAGCNATSKARCKSDNTLSTCDTTTGTWVDQTCSAATPVCTGSPGQCVECAPDSAWICVTGSNARHSCTNSKSITETCAAGQICDPADATCKAPTCATNELKCFDNVLKKCNANRTDWDTQQTCAGACYSGACVTCTPGSTSCSGSTGIRTCAADGSGYGTTTTECAADGISLKTCSGGVFSGSTPCPSNAPICSNGECVPAVCDVGQKQCSAAGVPQICNATRTAWDPLPACSGATPVCQVTTGTCGCSQTAECAAIPGAVCYGNQCVTATCNDGQFQCVDNKLQKCNATRTGWNDVATCSGTTPVCQAAAGTCGCSSSADCPSATPICSGNQCIAEVCSAGQTQCSGNVSQICNQTRTGWTDVTTCAGVTPICQTSTGLCGCSKSDDCADTPATPICSSGTCVAPTCSTGQHQCEGNVQQVCNDTRTGWVNEATCSGATPKCLTTTGMCGCSDSADCAGTPLTPICTAGVCVASTTTETATSTATATTTTTTTSTGTETDTGTGTGSDTGTGTGSDTGTGLATGTDTGTGTGTGTATTATATTTATSSVGSAATGTPAATLTITATTTTSVAGASCTTGAHHCDGNTQQICNATQSGWDTETACAGTTPICQTDTGTCGCASEADCSSLRSTPHCDTASRTCVACRSSSDCSGNTPICSSGQCAKCSATLVCPAGTCQPNGSCLVSQAK